MPEIAWRGVALLFVIAAQAVCIIIVLTGGAGEQLTDADAPTPDTSQAGLYCTQLALHLLFLLSMYLWNVDMLKVYSVFVTLLFFLMLCLAMRSLLDMAACVLCLPAVFLSNSIRDLMMPHCFTVSRCEML